MIEEKKTEISTPEVFVDLDNGKSVHFNMSLPLQILFDDVITFVSATEF